MINVIADINLSYAPLRFYPNVHYSHPESRQPLSALAPTLFPFFRHTIPNVRLAVVKTLHSFMNVSSLSRDWITGDFLRLLFQNLIVEERRDVRTATLEAWGAVLLILGSVDGWMESVVTSQVLLEWYAVLMTPLGMPLDITTFFDPHATANSNGQATERHNVDKNMTAQDLSLVPVEVVLCARIAAATALANVITLWPHSVRWLSVSVILTR